MVDEVKFLKTTIDFDVLLATTRDAVELYFEGAGIPVKYEEEQAKRRSSVVATELGDHPLSSLIDFLSYRDDVVQEQAIMFIIKRIPAEINQIREKGGIRPIVNLLNCGNETLQAHAAKALSILSADDASKDAIRNCGAIPDIFAVLAAAQVDRIKGLLLGTLLHLISCERNLPAIRACGGIPIVLGFMSAKPLPIQVASAQIIATLSPISESQYEITKAGGMRKIYKALRGDQMLQKEALKILTTFSKAEKGKEYILITSGCKHLLHVLKPELVIELPQENVRNSYMRKSTRGTVNFRSTLIAGRVKTQLFKSGQDPNPVLGWHKSSEKSAADKNEQIFQRTFQQVVFAIVINLAASERCRKNMCELGALTLFSKYLAVPPSMPIEILQLCLKCIFSLTTAANMNTLFGSQNDPLGSNCIMMLLQLAHVKDSSLQFLVASILDNLSKLPQYQSELGVGVPTLLRLVSTVDIGVKKIILHTIATLAVDDKVKKMIFDGGGVPTLIRIFSTNQPEIFPRITQLLTVLTSNDAMRKAIIFTGGIGHLLNLISISHDEQDLDIYIEAFSRLPVDEDGVAWVFHEEKSIHSLICLLYSNILKVKTMAVTVSSMILTNDGFKMKFDESGGTQAVLSLTADKDINVQVEAIRCITKLIQTVKIRKALLESGLIDKVKELGKHVNVKGAAADSAIVQALRALIVAIKVATQSSAPSPASAVKKAETVWIKCKLGAYAKMTKAQVGDSFESFIKTVLITYNLQKVQLSFLHGSDEVRLQSNADFDYILEQNKNDKKIEIIVREIQDPVFVPPPPISASQPTTNGGSKNARAYLDIQHSATPGSQFKPQIVIPVEPPKPLAISQILDLILRPLREDEIWCVCYLASKILSTLHKSGKLHKGIRQECVVITVEGDLLLEDGPFLLDRFLAPETTSPSKCTPKSDVYGLGACLWTCADFLLDEDEEPLMSAELLYVIEQMTDDEPSERPNIDIVLMECSKYEGAATNVLKELMKEVERKKMLKREFEAQDVEKQVDLSKKLLGEIKTGIQLKPVENRPPPAKSTNKSLLFEIENAVKVGALKLTHVDPPPESSVKSRQFRGGSFLKNIQECTAKRNIIILEQTYVEGMRLWARDIAKWNEEIQKVFLWNKNMVRIVFRLVEIMDDRVNFEEYVRILLIPKGQKLSEFIASQPPITNFLHKITLPQPSSSKPTHPPQPSLPATKAPPNKLSQPTQSTSKTLPNNQVSTRLPPNKNLPPNPTQPPTKLPPRVGSNPIPPGSTPSAPPARSPSAPQQLYAVAGATRLAQVKPLQIATVPLKPAPTSSSPAGSPRAGVQKPIPNPNNNNNNSNNNNNNSITNVNNNQQARATGRIRSSHLVAPPDLHPSANAQVDTSTKQKFATSLTRIGFSLKFNKYSDGAVDHNEYLDIFRPEDLPLSAFLKSILLCLKATHLINSSAQAESSSEKRSSRLDGKWSFMKS